MKQPIRLHQELHDLNRHIGTRRGRYAEQSFQFPRDIRPSCRGAALIRRERRRRRLLYAALWIAWGCAFALLILLAGGRW